MSWFINISPSKQNVKFEVAGQAFDLKKDAECYIPDTYDYVIEKCGLPLKKLADRSALEPPPSEAQEVAFSNRIAEAIKAAHTETQVAQDQLKAADAVIAGLQKELSDAQALMALMTEPKAEPKAEPPAEPKQVELPKPVSKPSK